MNDITREEVERIMALAEKATPGPWVSMIDDGTLLVGTPRNNDGTYWAIAERIGGKRKGPDYKDHSEEIGNQHLIAACDPQTILALCAAALRGIEGEEEPVAWRYRLIEELRSEDSHWTYREYDPKHESFEVEALYARSQR